MIFIVSAGTSTNAAISTMHSTSTGITQLMMIRTATASTKRPSAFLA